MAQELTGEFVREGYDIRLVARRQRQMLGLVGCCFITMCWPCLPFPFSNVVASQPIVAVLFFALMVLMRFAVIVATLMVMRALRTNVIVICVMAIVMLVPLVNLAVLFMENSHATKLLKKHGLRVRLFGVKDEDVVRNLARDLCHTCGYNLTGNVSGICPECGTPIPAYARATDVQGNARSS